MHLFPCRGFILLRYAGVHKAFAIRGTVGITINRCIISENNMILYDVIFCSNFMLGQQNLTAVG